MIALALLLLGPPRVAIALPAAQALAAAWQAQETRLACLYGHLGTHGGEAALWIDSVELAPTCGKPAIGMMGFLHDPAAEQEDVLRSMGAVLAARTDLLLVGEVHAITRVQQEGHWMIAPLAWWAIREPEPSAVRRA